MSIRILVILFLSASSLAAQVSHGGFQISARIVRGGSLALAAGATQVFTLTGAAAMSNSTVDACKGAIFTIPVSVTATS